MSLTSHIEPYEHILWSGTQNKKVSVMKSIFNPMLPKAVLWGIVELGFILLVIISSHSDSSSNTDKSVFLILIPFFLGPLMPVLLYLGGVLTAVPSVKKTNYCITDQAVYIQQGMFNTTTKRIPYQQIISVDTKQSFFNKHTSTGDVILKLDEIMYSGKHRIPRYRKTIIENIADYEEVYQTIMKYQSLFAADML